MKRQRLISEQGAHLGDKPDGEGKEDLKQKHGELAKKFLEVRNKVHNAETEVKTLQKEILDAEESYSEMNQQISDFAKRNALLTAYSKQCDQKTEMYTELAKQINDKLTVYKDIAWKKSSDPTYYTSQGILTGGAHMHSAAKGRATPTGLESACTQIVTKPEKAAITDSYMELMSKKKEKSIKESYSEMNQQISDFAKRNALLTAYSKQCDQKTEMYTELAKQINDKLTVYKDIAWVQDGSQRRIKEQLWTGVEKLAYTMLHVMSTCYFTRDLNHAELELVACRASLEYYKAAMNELTNDRNERQRTKEILHMKHKKIQDFEKLAESKQSLIQALVKQNSSAKARIEKQKLEHVQFIQDKISAREAHLVAMAKQLHNSVNREVDKFSTLPLYQFHYSGLESARRIPVSELSINRLENLSAKPGGEAMKSVMKNLDFPAYKAPEELLPTAMKLRAKGRKLFKDVEATAAVLVVV
ncbi:PREDICTED: uncharacterized protein LOC107328510 [Acropora digitifera]|uniref:uncharacterized protein LOC107328510 n=1 Tax=Acropora digitifera TaxID=70779 RepID=UPI00077B0D33|nr:PREDICTED: uncharacterized protein LOC107328510 [Acropora digitifera]